MIAVNEPHYSNSTKPDSHAAFVAMPPASSRNQIALRNERGPAKDPEFGPNPRHKT
jgi:hypothetical protein